MQRSVREAVWGAAAVAGFGLLAVVGLFAAGGIVPDHRGFAFAALGLGLAGGACGLAPHGAAYGLAPHGVGAAWISRRRMLTWAALAAAAVFLLGWGVLGNRDGVWRWFGLFAASFALVAAYCDAMAEAAPAGTPADRPPPTRIAALVPSLLMGALGLNALVHLFAAPRPELAMLAVIGAFLAFYLRRRDWRRHDGARGALPAPDIRRHRRTVFLCLYACPLLLTLIGMGKPGWFATACTTLAALSAAGGLVTERWLAGVESQTD